KVSPNMTKAQKIDLLTKLTHRAAISPGGKSLHGKLPRGGEESGGVSAEQYANAAYPAIRIGYSQVVGTQKAFKAAKSRSAGTKIISANGWKAVGPSTLHVEQLGTQKYRALTQESGRRTAT